MELSHDTDLLYNANFPPLIRKAEAIFSSWSHKRLSLTGKISVINTLANTLFITKLLSLPSPSQKFYKEYRTAVLSFLWNGKVAKISYNKLVQHTSSLGLKLVDIENKNIALKAVWPIRWCEKNDTLELDWFYDKLPEKSRHIWDLNTSVADVNKLRIPGHHNIALDIWAAWAVLNYSHEVIDFQEITAQYVIGNSHIRKGLRPIFDTKISNSPIQKVGDIVHPTQKTFPYL